MVQLVTRRPLEAKFGVRVPVPQHLCDAYHDPLNEVRRFLVRNI